MSELPRDHDRVEAPAAPRRPWVPPVLTPESADHTDKSKQFSPIETLQFRLHGPAS